MANGLPECSDRGFRRLVYKRLTNIIVCALARRVSLDANLPPTFGERLYYAGVALSEAFAQAAALLFGLRVIMLIAALGALVGVLAYLVPTQGWRRWRRKSVRRRH